MYYPAGAGTYALNASISSTATSITLSSFLEPVSGVAYTMALLNTDIAYATIAPRTTSSEFVSFTGITQNADGTATLTGVTRGLAKKYPFTASSVFRLPHSGQTVFILSDVPQVFVKYASIENNNSFSGVNAFTQNVTVPDPINNTDAANKEWVLTVVNGGPITVSQLIVAGTAGETIAIGNLVYLKAADARWYKSDADDATTINNVQLGIAQGSGSAAGAISGGVLIRGVDANQSGGVAGSIGYASNTAGGIATSTGTVEKAVGNYITASTFAFDPIYYYTPTAAIKAATAGGSTFGTPSSTNKFITQDYNSSATGLPVVHIYTANTPAGDSTTQFDITNPAGTTYRYTFDGTGTDPSFSLVNYPIGTPVDLQGQNFAAGNKGFFVTTGAGANYIEITNAGGSVESNKTIGTGYINKGATWTKPAGLKYITIKQTGAGNAGDGTVSSDTACSGGASAGYAEKLLATSVLAATVNYSIGYKITGTTAASTQVAGRTIFNHTVPIITTGGGITQVPGTASGGDISIAGQAGGASVQNSTAQNLSGNGGSTLIGMGGGAVSGANGNPASGYGAGGGGGDASSATDVTGGDSVSGVIILTEYFS